MSITVLTVDGNETVDCNTCGREVLAGNGTCPHCGFDTVAFWESTRA